VAKPATANVGTEQEYNFDYFFFSGVTLDN